MRILRRRFIIVSDYLIRVKACVEKEKKKLNKKEKEQTIEKRDRKGKWPMKYTHQKSLSMEQMQNETKYKSIDF